MTDDKMRELIRQSIVKASDKFTSELMHNIELQKREERKIRFQFLMAFAACIISFLLIRSLPSDISLPNLRLKMPSMTIRMIGLLAFAIVLNKLIQFRDQLVKMGLG